MKTHTLSRSHLLSLIYVLFSGTDSYHRLLIIHSGTIISGKSLFEPYVLSTQLNGATNCHISYCLEQRTACFLLLTASPFSSRCCCCSFHLLISLFLFYSFFVPFPLLLHLSTSSSSLPFSLLHFVCYYLTFFTLHPLSFKYPWNQTDRSDPFIPSSFLLILLHQHRLSDLHPN